MLFPESKVSLLKACRILFDSGAPYSIDFIRRLKPAALKVAYRKKVFETHPDRAMAVGRTEAEMSIRFHEVSRAYEKLRPYVSGEKTLTFKRVPPARPAASPPKSGPSRKPPSKDHFYKGNLPGWELKFGQFMYYSGYISWRMMIQAVVWQKSQRPMFGQIAQHWGFLSPDEVREIVSRKPYGEKFGEFALRAGLISQFQRMAVIGRQKLSQPPIGRFFLVNNLLSEKQLTFLLQKSYRHNQLQRRKKRSA